MKEETSAWEDGDDRVRKCVSWGSYPYYVSYYTNLHHCLSKDETHGQRVCVRGVHVFLCVVVFSCVGGCYSQIFRAAWWRKKVHVWGIRCCAFDFMMRVLFSFFFSIIIIISIAAAPVHHCEPRTSSFLFFLLLLFFLFSLMYRLATWKKEKSVQRRR